MDKELNAKNINIHMDKQVDIRALKQLFRDAGWNDKAEDKERLRAMILKRKV